MNSSGEILSPWSVPRRTEIGEFRKLSFNTEILLSVYNECMSLTNSSGTWRIFRILLIKLWFTSPNVFFKSNNSITRLWCCNLEELIILTRFLYVLSILIHLPKDPFKCPTLVIATAVIQLYRVIQSIFYYSSENLWQHNLQNDETEALWFLIASFFISKNGYSASPSRRETRLNQCFLYNSIKVWS